MWRFISKLREDVMTGISYMIPFVTAGGILLALSVLMSGSASVPDSGFAGDLAKIGLAGLDLMVPALSGYIAFSMADRPGIAPGFIGGYIANEMGAGFIGGIIAGLLAGYVADKLRKIKVSQTMRSIMPILVIPLITSFVVGGIMYWLVGPPVASFMEWLTEWLESLGTGNVVVLGIVLGAMIASDLGGPINKVAFGFGSALVGTIDPATGMPSKTALMIMAGIGVAIAVPPVGCGLATLITPKRFTDEEKISGRTSLVMGLVGLSEGAIPFAAANPLKVIPANMIGSAVGAVMAMVMGSGNPAPWGGLIVMPVCRKPWVYALSLLVGSIVTALIISFTRTSEQVGEKVEEVDNNLDEEFDFEIEGL